VGADPATPCFCGTIGLDARRLAELRERAQAGGAQAVGVALAADPERAA
jgi:hypothetical protein